MKPDVALTEVEFHTGVGDSVAFACRLLRKAYRQGARVWVTAPPPLLAELDRALWVVDERDFVPHVRVPGASAAVAARTAIWLSPGLPAEETDAAAPRVVVNLGAVAPADPAALDRLIEVVAADDAEGGRARWRGYKAAGFNIKHHPFIGNEQH